MTEEEIICNRCGFGSDELDEGIIPTDWFAIIGYEMYCNDCVLEHKDGVWKTRTVPDPNSPQIIADGNIMATQLSANTIATNKLWTSGPLYTNQSPFTGTFVPKQAAQSLTYTNVGPV